MIMMMKRDDDDDCGCVSGDLPKYGNMPLRHDDRKKSCWESFFSFEGDLKEAGPPTMDYFHTQLFHKLSLVSKEKVRFKAIISHKHLLTKWLVPVRNTARAFSGDLDLV